MALSIENAVCKDSLQPDFRTAADEDNESELQPMTSPKTSNDCR